MADATINAPRGQYAATVRRLQAVGLMPDAHRRLWIQEKPTEDAQSVLNDLCRQGVLTFESRLHRPLPRAGRHRLTPETLLSRLPEHILRRALDAGSYYPHRIGPYPIFRDDAQRELLRRGLLSEGATLTGGDLQHVLDQVGPAGEQAQADEARYFAVWDDAPSSTRRNVARIDTIDVAPGYTAALVTRHVVTFYQRSLRSSQVECVLVVRDATSGERHLLRVPPKFGSYRSKTRTRLLESGGPRALIHAAIAWTFDQRPEEYHPDVAA